MEGGLAVNIFPRPTAILVGVVLPMSTCPAVAHQLTGPATVVAEAAGDFAYELTLVIAPAAEFLFSEMNGSDNTDIGWWTADGFCLEVVEAGTYPIEVTGTLVDPTLPGTVIYTHAMCNPWWQDTVTTTILPHPVSAVPEDVLEQRTWGAVKSLFR